MEAKPARTHGVRQNRPRDRKDNQDNSKRHCRNAGYVCPNFGHGERSKRSKKEHLDALEYKVKVQEKRAALAEHAQKAAEEKQEAASERAKEIAIKNADAVFKLQNKNAELTRTAKEVENLRSQMQFCKGIVDSRTKRIEALRSEISGLSEQKNEVLELIGQKNSSKKTF